MAIPIVMPKLAMAMKQGKISEWRVDEGARVEKGRVVIIIETDKVTYEIESPDSGFFHIGAELNKNILCEEIIAWLAETEEELAGLQANMPSMASFSDVGPKDEQQADARPSGAAKGKLRISPAARKMAKDAGIDINTLVGSPPGARIVKEDVLKAVEARDAAPQAKADAQEKAPSGQVIDGKRVRATLPLTGIRGVVAEHMISSLKTSAQLSVMGEVDVTGLVRFRQSCLRQEAELNIRIWYTDILVCILAKVLKEQPIMNASLIGDSITLWDDVNIGVAVALPEEEYDSQLVVPVVHHADRMTLSEISRAISDIVKRARENRLTMDDISCGTFTLSNLGTLSQGYSFTTPILNQPQAAILGTGPIVKRPLVEDDQIVIRPVMNYNLTFDHRVINGAPAAGFINRMTKLLQDPGLFVMI